MKTFLSIGSGAGVGLATAERFASEGFLAVLSARNAARARALADQLEAKGHQADARQVDAGDPASVASLIADVERSFGGIHVLHYNVASIRKATIAEQPLETFNADLAVNIGGALAAIQAVLPGMRERGFGSILLTGGGYSLKPSPQYLSLSIGKAGVRVLVHALFDSLARSGVHVATVTVMASLAPGSSEVRAVAEHFWTLHNQPKAEWIAEVEYPG